MFLIFISLAHMSAQLAAIEVIVNSLMRMGQKEPAHVLMMVYALIESHWEEGEVGVDVSIHMDDMVKELLRVNGTINELVEIGMISYKEDGSKLLEENSQTFLTQEGRTDLAN